MRTGVNTFGSVGDIHPYMAIRELLEQPEYARNAIEISEQLKQENGPARAADLIKNVLGPAAGRDEELVHVAGD